MKLKKIQKKRANGNYELEGITSKYREAVNKRMNEISSDEDDPQVIWEKMKEIIQDEAHQHLPKKERKKNMWLSGETIKVAKDRKDAKKVGDWNKVRELNRIFQRKARQDKDKFISKKCREIEEHSKTARSKEMFQVIRAMTMEFKPTVGSVKSDSGQILTNKEEIIKRWEEYVKNLYRNDN